MTRDAWQRIRLGMIALLLSACSGGDGKQDLSTPDLGQDLPRPDQLLPDQQITMDQSLGPHVTDTHNGWKKPLCLSCHDGTTAKNAHPSSSYKAPDCVGCHGLNGARHSSHAASGNCVSCHTPHETGYAIPKDCATCHYHPSNPEGV